MSHEVGRSLADHCVVRSWAKGEARKQNHVLTPTPAPPDIQDTPQDSGVAFRCGAPQSNAPGRTLAAGRGLLLLPPGVLALGGT